jgi:glycerol-3-phosphate acyltransferase PlsX
LAAQKGPAIAIDAMGGDRAPREVVRGAILAAREDPRQPLLLAGDEARVHEELRAGGWDGDNIEVVPARCVIGMSDSPVEALRRKRGSSIEVATRLVKDGRAFAVLGAGNTGACVAASTLLLGVLPNVKKAGIAVAFTTGETRVVVIDVGANVYSKPEHLIQYGVMASLYAREILGVEQPRVGLLNIGEEDEKGNLLAKATHALFQKTKLNFIGNVEGVELFRGACEVVVCDGFVGNIVLKTAEGMAERLMGLFQKVLTESFDGHSASAEISTALKTAMGQLERKLDYSEYGGAPLLGVNGVTIIAHGRSDAKAIFNAIRVARRMGEIDLNGRFSDELCALSA